MILCQLTDLHLRPPGKMAYGRVDTNRCFAEAVDQLLKLQPAPDAYLLTGDLTDSGRADEYAVLADGIARLDKPVYLMPGNHDNCAGLRAAFPAHAYLAAPADAPADAAPDCVQYRVDLDGTALIALDTVVPGQPHGALDAARLAWLAGHLDQTTPTIIAMHHPPFATGIAHMDRIGLMHGAAELEALMSKHHNIERVLCGHLHRSIQARFANTIASTCPSTAHQISLALAADAQSSYCLEPPGYQLHTWQGGRLVTHTGVFGDFAGPLPFRDPA